MQKLGVSGHPGYDIADLQLGKAWFESKGCTTELVCLHDALPNEADVPKAWILIVPGGVRALGLDPDAIYAENMGLEHDKKFFDRRRKKVLNKHARYNLCYAEESQRPDYENGKGTVVGWKSIPHSKGLQSALSVAFGAKAANLNAELNVYYDPLKCGIGFHGDTERPDVIAARFGCPMNIVYQWFRNSHSLGLRVERMLPHGCIYIMSKKAVGQDWKKSSILTLRHAAGCKKYTSTKTTHGLMSASSPSSSPSPPPSSSASCSSSCSASSNVSSFNSSPPNSPSDSFSTTSSCEEPAKATEVPVTFVAPVKSKGPPPRKKRKE